jgi:hypothetical protein
MELTRHADAAALLRAAQGFLEEDEERTGLLFGLALRLVDQPHLYGAADPYLATVDEAGEPGARGADGRRPTPSSCTAAAAAVPLVIADLVASGAAVAGVMGPVELAAEAAHGVEGGHGPGQRARPPTSAPSLRRGAAPRRRARQAPAGRR